MKKRAKRWLALGLSAAMCMGAVPASASEGQELTTITLYPKDANISSGVVSGYKGDYFASLGLEVEVWAYSDEKTNAILASGDLPDVMYIPMDDVDTMIEAGMLLNLDEYLDQIPHVQAYEPLETALEYVREYRSNGTGSVYAMPLDVGKNVTELQWPDSTERNAVKIRWDVYEEIGAPEITCMDDLLDVMEQMLEAHPEEEDGTLCYGTVLNSGSDTTKWECMRLWYAMQGYNTDGLPYLLEINMVDGSVDSILSTESQYYKGLKWYNEAYQRGLMDPESINNDRATQKPKVDNGYAMIPSGNLPGWINGQYLEYLVPGTQVYYNSNQPYGSSSYMIGINAKTENLEACLTFIDMLTNPDSQLYLAAGPDGELWYSDEEGNAYFTEAGAEYMKSGNFTGYVLSSGEELSLWNTSYISNTGADTSFGDGNGGKRSARTTGWLECNQLSTEDNELFHQWQETTGYTNWQEWLAAENGTVESSSMDYINNFLSIPDDMMQLTIDAIKDKVVTASWKMVYAESEEEFNQIWEQMVSDCEGLGAQDIMEWRLADIENAKQIRDSLSE